MEIKIIRADKKVRIYYIILMVLLIGAAFLLYRYWQGYYSDLTDLAENHPEQALTKLVSLIKVIIYVNPIVTAGFMLYFIIIGTKTYRTEQFPPPGIRVIRDTKLSTGEKAKKYAVGMWFMAALLLVFAIFVTVLMNNFLITIY